MAKINLDNLVNDLRDRNAAKQDRLIVSGNLATMPMPPAVLFHPWRQPSPGLYAESETSTTAAKTASTARKPETVSTSRSGSPATSGTAYASFCGHQLSVGHDCQSHVLRDARLDGDAAAPAGSSGK